MKQIKKRIFVPIVAVGLLLVISSFKGGLFEIAKQVEIFTTLFKELNINYVDDTNPAKLMDSAIKNMLKELDPYTVFLNEQDIEGYEIRNRGKYSGIGIFVRSIKDKLIVLEVYKGYPADKAGLKAGDEIVQIGDVKVTDFKEEAIDLLKGARNTTVDIIYKRYKELHTTKVTREEIEIDAVPFYKMIDEETGYIILTRFNRKATKQTKVALEELKAEGATKIILDLRHNPGGLLSEAINIVNLFIDKGEVIVTTKSKVQKFNRVYKTRNNPVDTQIPLVILINEKSASASEIVSGALQDLDRAIVMGIRSFGKGLVQRQLKLTYGTQLKITISRYYTPSGRCIQSLDYWNRDEEGKAVKNKEFKSFKTRNGRNVLDGGGVSPDIKIASLETNRFVKSLEANQVIFNFATDYVYKNPEIMWDNFNFTEEDYQKFKSFVKNSDFHYDTKTEKKLQKIMRQEEVKTLGEKVQQQFKNLMSSIEKSKNNSLETHKISVIEAIKKELVKRYFYREGLYKYNLTHDKTIQTARELLADQNKYQEILR